MKLISLVSEGPRKKAQRSASIEQKWIRRAPCEGKATSREYRLKKRKESRPKGKCTQPTSTSYWTTLGRCFLFTYVECRQAACMVWITSLKKL